MEQGPRHGCVLALPQFNTFFAAVMNLAYTRFKADKEDGGRGEATAVQPWRRLFDRCGPA